MTVIFVGGFGRNALKAIQVAALCQVVSIDENYKDVIVPEGRSVLIAGLGSRKTEAILRYITPDCPKMKFILVKPFKFEHKDARVSRCLVMIPGDCETYIFDNQEMANKNRNLSIADFQRSLFAKIESVLMEISSKLDNSPVFQ